MAWLTPSEDEGQICVVLSIPATVEWIACLKGAILSLTYAYNWEKYGSMTPQEVAQKWLEIFVAMEVCDNNLIKDIQFDGSMLQKMFCGSDAWVDIGDVMRSKIRLSGGAIQFDLDGDDTYEISQFFDASTNNYDGALFPVTDTDKLCFTAQRMAEDTLDDFQDLLQVIDWNTTSISTFVRNGAQALFNSLPAQVATLETGLVLAAGLNVLYEISDATLDYLIAQCSDPDVIALTANFIFCALSESLVTEDGVTDVVDFGPHLTDRLGVYFKSIDIFGSIPDGFTMDFAEILTDLFEAPNKVIAALACSYVLAEVYFLDPIGLKSDWKSVIIGYANQAAFLDGRDCPGFECLPELLVNFQGDDSPVPYTVVLGNIYEQADDLFTLRKTGTGSCETTSGLHCVEFIANFEEAVSIAKIHIYVSSETSGSPPGEVTNYVFVVKAGSTTLYNDYKTGQDGVGMQLFSFDITEVSTEDIRVKVKRGTSGSDTCDLRITNIIFERA